MLSVPILRFGHDYRSLDTAEVVDPRTNEPLASVSQANAGLIRRDLRRAGEARGALSRMSCARVMEICTGAAELFLNATLPIGGDGQTQSPQQYVQTLSATSGLPHRLCRLNMSKIHTVLAQMPKILRGLMRGLDLCVIDSGIATQSDVPVSYAPTTDALGVVLPSNSPGVNSIWLPAVGLKIPVMLKPGREGPWTPMRIVQALITAGYPRQAFGFYPTGHDGAEAILTGCGRGILFGDDATTARYAANPNIERHGSGRSKVIIGPDAIANWPDLIDVLMHSILDNAGRSCINASCIIVPEQADAIAEALAQRLAKIEPRPADADDAELSAFANERFAQYIDTAIEQGLQQGGAVDVTAQYRQGPRRVSFDGLTYLRPTIIRCESFDHPLANSEFLFPFASIVQMPIEDAASRIGPTLVATVITDDPPTADHFIACPQIDRLNLGAIPTSRVEWDQPHEGNLFEFLYRRRAIQRAAG